MQIFAIGASNPANVTVSENIIEWSIHNGILIAQNSDLMLENNEIRFNGTGTQYYAAVQLSNQSSPGLPDSFTSSIVGSKLSIFWYIGLFRFRVNWLTGIGQ